MTERIVTYIYKLLGLSIVTKPYTKEKSLPNLLRGFYQFCLCSGNGVDFLLMCDKGHQELTPGSIVKHGELARQISGLPVVFATDNMPAYNRGRLLQKSMPFVIPERQIFLPFLGTVLSESGQKSPKEFSELGILAQQLFLARLNKNFTEPLSIEAARKLVSYSRVSIIRAFNELEFFNMARRDNKTRHLVFHSDLKALWDSAQRILFNPCRRVVGLGTLPVEIPGIPAGTSALAAKTMLNESRQPEYAVQVGVFNKLEKVPTFPRADAPVLLQLWIYSPTAVGENTVDPFSLYLTLKDNPDERIQIALDEMMGGLSW